MPRAKPIPKTRAGLTFDDARTIALALDGVEEGTSYRTPAFKVGGKLLARLREDGETLVVPVDLTARDMLLRSDPETFYITDHYAAHPYVLVRLPRVKRGVLAALLEEAWGSLAPKRSRPRASAKTAPPAQGRAQAPRAASAISCTSRVRSMSRG
jgi:hypothetical protein